MTPYVTFEPEAHTYTLHGDGPDRVLPSVTQIIQDNRLGFDFSKLPKLDLAWYGDRGTKVHLACHYLDQGILNWKTVHPKIEGFVKSYQLGKHQLGWTVLHSEMLVFDNHHRFAGQLDKVIELGPKWKTPGAIAQGDLKSGSPHPSHGIQTAAYNIGLAREYPQYRNIPRYGIYLDPDGGIPRVIPYSDVNDFTIFESALNLTLWRNDNGTDA